MSDKPEVSIAKLTKKELLAKIVDLEKELDIWKTKTQLARNYNILKAENEALMEKIRKKQEYWKEWASAENELNKNMIQFLEEKIEVLEKQLDNKH